MLGLLLLLPRPVAAQPSLPPTDDKTATHPLNLQQIVTLSNEFASLPDERFIDTVAYRYAIPLAGRRVSAGLVLPLVTGNITGRTEAAFGDLGARLVWIPWLTIGAGLLGGLEITWNTATNDALGVGRHTVTPFVQLVISPSAELIVAPRFGQRMSAGGDRDRPDVQQSVVGVYAVWLPAARMWMAVEPEVTFDIERDRTAGELAFEYGRLLFGGVGTYVRPHVGVGRRSARPFDWAVEVGFRIVP